MVRCDIYTRLGTKPMAMVRATEADANRQTGVKVCMIYTSDCCHLCYICMVLTLCAFIAR